MRLNLSLSYDGTEEYLIRLSSVELNTFLSKEVAAKVSEQVEVVEVCLERIRGKKTTNIAVLMQIAKMIANFFKQNEDVILYFFCDDLNDIPRRQTDLSPQKFRSRLFSQMYSRYTSMSNITEIQNVSICIDSSGWKNYIHFLVRSKHMPIMDMIQKDVLDGFGK